MILSIQAPIINRIIIQNQSVFICSIFVFSVRFGIYLETRSDEEKDRLANLMAYGVDPTKMPVKSISDSPPPPSREIDRFDECRIDVS